LPDTSLRADTLWKQEPATAAKHELYKRYLDAWWPILLQPTRGRSWERVTYLDAFAGPGRYEGGEPGSPVFAIRRLLRHSATGRMNLRRERVRLLFLEKRSDRFSFLESELERQFGPLGDLPVWPQARQGEAGKDAERLLTDSGAWGSPVLAVFDSWGNVNVPLSLMKRIAANPASEVIVTFGPNWFSRQERRQPEHLDLVFGGRGYWESADAESRPDERWRKWLATYKDALRRAGFRYQLQFQIVLGTGQPLYLVYGTRHPKGVEVMKDAMWDVDGTDGMKFADPRTRNATPPGQLALWSGPEHAELEELVRQCLADGPVSLDKVRNWLLTETARWRARDAIPVIKELWDTGQVTVSPAGRLTGKSVITLR
jgi:three-Cys-motif partner protein